MQESFEALVQALRQAEFSSADVDELLQVLAGLLHLSNVSFAENQSAAVVLQGEAAKKALELAAFLLGVERTELQELLCCRRINLKGDVFVKQRNHQQSSSTRCSLIKFIYSRVFDHLVHRLNESVAREMQRQEQGNDPQEQHYNGTGDHRSIGSKPAHRALHTHTIQ